MKYYVIKYQHGAPGCPAALFWKDDDGGLDWDNFNPDIDSIEIKREHTAKVSNRSIDFDFFESNDIASAEFIEIVKKYSERIKEIPVRFIVAGGKNPKKDYFYIVFGDWFSIIDLNNSSFEYDRDLSSGDVIYNKYFPEIPNFDKIEKFSPDPSKDPKRDIFKSLDFFGETICSEKFMKDCYDRKIIGLEFIPIEDFQYIPFWHQD